MKAKYKIIALFGKAGSGKDTIAKYLCANYPKLFNEIVSCTTRPPRDYEENGSDYHFISIEDFTKQVLSGEMLEATEFRNWFYGTQASALSEDKINVGVFNIAGIEALLENHNLNIIPVLVYASDKTRLMRQLNREKNPDCAEICRRFQTDDADFSEADFEPLYVWDNYDTPDYFEMMNLFKDNLCALAKRLDLNLEDDLTLMGQN